TILCSFVSNGAEDDFAEHGAIPPINARGRHSVFSVAHVIRVGLSFLESRNSLLQSDSQDSMLKFSACLHSTADVGQQVVLASGKTADPDMLQGLLFNGSCVNIVNT